MAIYRYPPEVHEFVKRLSPVMHDKELAAACNEKFGTEFTASGMKSFRGNHGYRNDRAKQHSDEYWKYQTKYPKGMYEFIRDNSQGVSSTNMADMVNERFGTDFNKSRMKEFRRKYGIKSGVTGWFKKGATPYTKGKTLEEICKNDPVKLAKIRATQFREGNRPVNELPVGSITVAGNGYKVRKIAMDGSQWERWEFIHRAVWVEHNGPIPEGYVLAFKDGDRMNCELDNLMLVSRSEQLTMSRRGYWFEDPDLTETAINLVRLQEVTTKKRKERNERSRMGGRKKNAGDKN